MPAVQPVAEQEAVDVNLATSSLEELILEANSRYTRAQDALLSGNWAAYGAELDGLERILDRMLEVSGLSAEPTPQPLPSPAPTPAAEASSG